jgi:hypothetical protein
MQQWYPTPTLLNLLSLSTSFTSFILVSSQMGLPSNRGAWEAGRQDSSTQAATAAGVLLPTTTALTQVDTVS